MDELDSAWLMAKPVRYTDAPLRSNTTEGLAELMFYNPMYSVQKLIEEYTHTKTTNWEYEKEWRIASWKRPHESGDYSDYGFFANELVGITFGARIEEGDRKDLKLLVEGHYPNVKFWQAAIKGGRRLVRQQINYSEQDENSYVEGTSE